MNIEVKKYNIIQLIMSVADERLIDEIYSEVKRLIETSIEEEPTITSQNKKKLKSTVIPHLMRNLLGF